MSGSVALIHRMDTYVEYLIRVVIRAANLILIAGDRYGDTFEKPFIEHESGAEYAR